MQYHLDGVRPGDPRIAPARPDAGTRHDRVDVLIVGCGPAGLTLAAQLSRFADITTRIVERKPGPLEMGQADGIACRSVEMFQAFGFAERVISEGYRVNEVTFWRPDPAGTLTRVDRIDDVEHDLSEMPHIILSQARVHDFYLEAMRNGPHRLTPDYDRELVSLARDDGAAYPITATFDRLDAPGETETVRARYVVGCDGARSRVRAELGYRLRGDSARQLWGVMDVLPRTDFPDIRLKSAIQSAADGSILIIPREGGHLVRLYIELDALHGDERAADRDVSAEMLVDKARRILAPYTFDVAEVAWWSAYEIGQRVCDAFDDVAGDMTRRPRIFIAGDACHTHSPKAGQGMNVSMADAWNLGWKLAAVLRGQSDAALLHSYSAERAAKARELIDFDRDMARLFSARPRTPEEASLFQQYFKKHGRYTAGVETRYDRSALIGPDDHQALARGLVIGKRFHSAPVVRLADAKPMHLGHAFAADGRWRILVFAPRDDDLAATCAALDPVIARFTPRAADPDAVIDLRAVFQSPHREMRIESLPPLLLPVKGRHRLTDYEKVFCAPHPEDDIFDRRGIDRARGALIVLRPDGYVSHVLPPSETAALERHLAGVLLAQPG